MRIKKIEITGFKSFADRQVVHVDDRVTGVIGPNGCGKSNIVDAIRWTLGEQRAKHLRGSGMRDVIFAGCATRGPGGMAEVTLTFANEGDVPVAYINSTEVAITRRLYSDGTSEYLINKVPCRLRDIKELMLGTGAGARGYSIIEQGQVGSIVSSKPEERRNIIDEAAGITRFKGQKVAAERRIEQTQQNLLRVSDVLRELEGRLGTLRRQAQKAERYKRYRQELRDLELWSSSHRLLELEVTGRILGARRTDLAEQVDALRQTLGGHEARIEPLRLAMREREASLKAAQEAVFDLERRLQVSESEEGFRRREQESLRQAVDQARAEAAAVEDNLGTLEGELAEVREELASLEEAEDSGGAEEALASLESEHEAVVRELRGARAEVESCRAERGRLETTLASLRATLSSRAEATADLEQRLAGLADERQTLEESAAAAEAELAEVRDGREAAEYAVEELRTRRHELDQERQELRAAVKRSEGEVAGLRAEIQRARSRQQSLEEIQGRYRGCASGVQVVMARRDEVAQRAQAAAGVHEVVSSATPGEEPPGILGILADYIHAPAELEAAVSAIFGERLQGIVVDRPAVGREGVALLKEVQEGRLPFLPRACRTSPAGERPDLTGLTGVRGYLVECIDVEPTLAPLVATLLGDAIVVDDLRRALELWHDGMVEAPIVTLEGDRLEPNGVIVGGSAKALDSALLQQKREIRELGELLGEREVTCEAARAAHEALEERLAAVEAEREASEARFLEAERVRIAQVEEARRLEQGLTQMTARIAGFEREHARLLATLESRIAERAEQETTLAASEAALPALEERLVTGDAHLESLAIRRDQVGEMLTEAKVTQARWQQQLGSLREAKSRLERQVASERDRGRRLAQHAAESEARILEIEGSITAAKEERVRLLDSHTTAVDAGHDAREAYDGARLEVDASEQAIRNLRGQLDEERERLSEVEMAVKELTLERGHLHGDIRERFDVDLVEVLIDFHDRPRAGAAEVERVKELRRLLARIGEVNLTAIDEFEEVSSRFDYLSAQKGDLEAAIAQLEEAIDTINKTTRERFAETFKAVNEMFQTLFPRLFNGGRAALKLTDPSDLLATGVEIVAQPPGKQVRSLELLSGGEKALTATSLIFAIFLIKPSPFCLLDEVDAPLDEANVGRFSNLVRELSERTQFIIITHNKRTMEAADRLYGVTMEQRGVSKLVSVNMRRAVELAS